MSRWFLCGGLTFTLLTSAGLASAPGGPCERPAACHGTPVQDAGKLVVKTYAVADLVVPVDRSEKVIRLGEAVEGGEVAKECGPACTGAAVSPCAHNAPATEDERLIKVITCTVVPKSWSEMGGEGTIDYHPLTMSLVISQTPAVHEQVADLLANLRRLQGVEVAVQVLFVTLAEDHYRHLPRDFAAADGAALRLDDTQVLALLEWAQADRRTKIMQAPKLTMFNGQRACLDVTETQHFVTGVDVVRKGDEVVYRPKNEPFHTGLKLGVCPVVAPSGDKVALELNVRLTNLDSAAVPARPVMTFVKRGPDDKAVPFTQFVQQPTFYTLSMDKTLSVPAGRTALLGGWVRKREVRDESLPAILSKLPFVNQQLLKDAQVAHRTEHVLVLVTPRVVIHEEEGQAVAQPPRIQCAAAECLPYPAVERCAAEMPQAPPDSPAHGPSKAEKVAKLMKKYHDACAEGHTEKALKIALRALALDPTCFHHMPAFEP
jgi:hypothetical protein